MSKQNQENDLIPAGAIEGAGAANAGLKAVPDESQRELQTAKAAAVRKKRTAKTPSSRSSPEAQSRVEFEGATRPEASDKRTVPAADEGIRIQFADTSDLDSPARRAAVSAGVKPIAFARRLAEAPVRAAAIAPASSPGARIYGLVRAMIQRLGRQLSQSLSLRVSLRQSRQRNLDILEIRQLGEKRFVAIVRVGKQKFLIGGAAASVSLLAEINPHSATVIAPRALDQEMA
jgi:hypothetical protein